MTHENVTEPTESIDPRVYTGAGGQFTTDNGSHRLLHRQDPIYLTNMFLLHNLAVAGNDAARKAFHRRLTGFHEAGHLWAAHQYDIHIAPVRLNRRAPMMRLPDEYIADLVAAAGPLAMAVAMEADLCEFAGRDPGFGHEFGDAMDPPIALNDTDFDPNGPVPPGQHRRSETYMIHVANYWGRDEYCLRGGDAAAEYVVADVDCVDAILPMMLGDWPGLRRLAGRLLAGPPLGGVEVDHLLTDPGHDW